MIGKEISGYRIDYEIAEGGMGMVYGGISLKDNTPVAIKVLREEISKKRADVGRFIREAVIYKRLRHPNLIRFYHFGFEQDMGFYLITELLEGDDLEEALLAQGIEVPFPLQRALDIALQICAGLATAHDEGVIHRDLKPANIFLVSQPDGSEQVKVFDFGISKLTEQEVVGAMTQHGIAIGTPLYMAPEQIRGEKDIGPTVDIYALGVILFQMVTGHLPFTGEHPMMILAAHLKKEPPLLRKYQRFLAGTELENLIDAMLKKDPSDRPGTLEKVKEGLWGARKVLTPNEHSATMVEIPSFSSLQDLIKDPLGDSREAEATEPEKEKPVAVLLQHKDGLDDEVGWLLPGEKLQIGSAPGSGVRIKKGGVQPEHAELHASNGGWITIKKLNNSVVRVNGASVSKMVLRDGDSITLGDVVLKLQCFNH